MSSRQLAAIMFTDIIGYTALMSSDQEKAMNALRENRRIHKECARKYKGRVVKEMGDGQMLSFNTVFEAVLCAGAIIESVSDLQDYKLKLGIHLGEVTFDNNDVFGDGVNLAARIHEDADPNQILISEAVYQNIRNQPGITADLIGSRQYKNIHQPVKVYSVALAPDLASRIEGQEKKGMAGKWRILLGVLLLILVGIAGLKFFDPWPVSSPESGHTIAVLPFKLIGDDQEGQYFADGVMTAVIGNLNKINNLEVRSRTSVEQFVNPEETVREIAKELGVKYLIEGSAQKYQDDIRIAVQLIDAEKDKPIWDEQYDRAYADIFNVQSEIALRISEAMGMVITQGERRNIEETPTESKEAWDLFLKGQYYQRRYANFNELPDIDFAIDFYLRSLENDPFLAQSLSLLALALLDKHWLTVQDDESLQDSIFHLISKAVKLDPDLDLSYRVLGAYYFKGKKDTSQAVKYYRQAIHLDPNNQDNYTDLIWLYISAASIFKDQQMTFDSVLIYAKIGLEQEPGDKYALLLRGVGVAYFCLSEVERAEDFIDKSLEIEPDNILTLTDKFHVKLLKNDYRGMLEAAMENTRIRDEGFGLIDLAKAYMLLEDYQNAERHFATFYAQPEDKHAPINFERTGYAYTLRKLGREQEAEEQIKLAEDWIRKWMDEQDYDLAKVYAFLGEREMALEHLEQFEPFYGLELWIDDDPLFDILRTEPRYLQVLRNCEAIATSNRNQVTQRLNEGVYPTLMMLNQ